jgi:hypothetical protein
VLLFELGAMLRDVFSRIRVFNGSEETFVCMAVWLNCTTSQTGPGSNPGAGSADQAVHLQGRQIGSNQYTAGDLTTVELCEGKASGCTMAGVRLMQPAAQTTARWFHAVRTGVFM